MPVLHSAQPACCLTQAPAVDKQFPEPECDKMFTIYNWSKANNSRERCITHDWSPRAHRSTWRGHSRMYSPIFTRLPTTHSAISLDRIGWDGKLIVLLGYEKHDLANDRGRSLLGRTLVLETIDEGAAYHHTLGADYTLPFLITTHQTGKAHRSEESQHVPYRKLNKL